MSINELKYGKVRTYRDWETYAHEKLSGDDYESGQLEAVVRRAENNSAAIGRLLEGLLNTGHLTTDNVEYVLKGFVEKNLEVS
jgi:hypothetical protein